jgi:D-alanyl-D-alanine carboxypeptidase/D-alanyl-D-alanine carboxypeptidase (penicillin-binding protein 5/6)
MNEEAPNQFEDTVALFEYGFQNFEPYSIADNDTKYTVNHTGFFASDSDFFGSSKPLMELDSSDYIVLPINASFEDTISTLSYTDLAENEIARVNYTYNETYVGYGSLVPANAAPATFDFSTAQAITTPVPENESKTVYINVKNIIIGIIVVFFALMLLLMLITFIVNTRKSRRRHRIMSRRRGDTRYLDWKGFK